MYSDDPTARYSQARTSASYATASPRGSFLPPPLPQHSNLSIGQSIASTPRASSADPFQDAANYPEREPLNASDPISSAALPTSPEAYKENSESSPFVGAGAAAGGYGGYSGTGASYAAKPPFYKRPLYLFLGAALLVAVVVAVVVPVVITHNNKSHTPNASSAATSGGNGSGSGNGNGNGSGSNGGGGGKGTNNLATWGGDGSTVTQDDGSTFTYHNSFGGIWVDDPNNPLNNSAKPNSWTPALGEKWTWGVNRINGVNLGGLFVLEPFIAPSLFQPYNGTIDEWHLSQTVASSGNLTDFLSQHYSTFITEQDIAQIAGAGLNFIRLPIPFWAIETWQDVGSDGTGPDVGEPFLAKVCWTYILRILRWARKYGIRVNLDLHAVPGSQNGYNHSGKQGQINFMNGVMGYANAQRTLDYIRTITEFVSQPEYVDLIPMFSIVNEALVQTIGMDQITSFYLQAHTLIRSITGTGEGHGPFMTIHDGFKGLGAWSGFLTGSDRIGIDTHPYFAFDGQPNTDPINVPADGGDGTMMGGVWPKQACNAWGPGMNTSRQSFGVTVAGEFSNAINDCGLFVRGVGNGPQYPGDCTPYNDWQTWDDNMKNGFQSFILASMDALGDYFFWTWKIGNDTTNTVQSPLWSYQLGLENGWIPNDPRQAAGMCAKLGVTGPQFDGTFQPYQTGGAGAGTIAPSSVAQFSQWPPTSLAGVPTGQVPMIPSYTASRAPVTLPPPSQTASVSQGNGWFDAQDTQQFVTAVSGCTYPDAWNAQNSPVPAVACGATASLGGAAPPPPTPAAPLSPPPAVATTSAPSTSAPGAVVPSSSSVPPAAPVPPPVRARKPSHKSS